MANSRAQITHFIDRLWGGAQFQIEKSVLQHKPLFGGAFSPLISRLSKRNVFYTEYSYGNRLTYLFILNEEGKRMALYAVGGNNIQISVLSIYAPFAIGLLIILCVSSFGVASLIHSIALCILEAQKRCK